jgi:hypothetical protein
MFPVFSLVSGNSGRDGFARDCLHRQDALCGQSLCPRIAALKPRDTAVSGARAVHLELALEARNHSLTPGFLCGRSLGPFGTHFTSAK